MDPVSLMSYNFLNLNRKNIISQYFPCPLAEICLLLNFKCKLQTRKVLVLPMTTKEVNGTKKLRIPDLEELNALVLNPDFPE